MKIVLYTINCPNCIILEKKLKQSNIEFETINDINIMSEKGIMSAPTLEVDGELMNYAKAMRWIGERDNEKQ